MIGLKRGTVQLCEHEKEWEIEAQNTIDRLKEIFGAEWANVQPHSGAQAKTFNTLEAPLFSR